MWHLSSLHKVRCFSLIGGSKCTSYMPSSRYAATFSGYFGQNVGGERQKDLQGSSANSGRNWGLNAGQERFSDQHAFKLPSSIQSAGPTDSLGRNSSRTMDYVRGIIENDNFRYSRHNVEQNADFVLINLKRNNTFINVLDSKGNTKFKATSGFKEVGGAGKVSRYAAEATAEFVGRKAREMGLKSVVVRVKGFTYFKKKRQAIMSFREGFSNSRSDQNPIVYIEDVTQRPHNGCRLPKKRRI